MSDVFREVTRTGYGTRVKNAIGGIVVGAIFFLGAFPLTWWNEGRAVKQRKSLEEGAAAVIELPDAQLDAANQGRLVHVAGRVEAQEPVTDEQFGLTVDALGLQRRVEMYQWDEDKETRERKKLGGGTETETIYTYDLKWSDEPIDSSDFRQPEGHANPGAFPFANERFRVQRAQLGAFTLGPELVGKLGSWQPHAFDASAIRIPEGFRANGSMLYRGADASAPQVGDVRISFRTVPEGDYSIVGRQSGGMLDEYPTRAGNAILLVDSGIKPAAAMFASAQRSNTILTWILRGAGFALMWLGLVMVFKPLSVILDVVPLLGRIASIGIGIVAFVVALIGTLTTIAIAWVFYRPVLAFVLIGVAVASVVLLRRRRPGPAPAGGAQAPPPPPQMPPPPPPPARAA